MTTMLLTFLPPFSLVMNRLATVKETREEEEGPPVITRNCGRVELSTIPLQVHSMVNIVYNYIYGLVQTIALLLNT